VTPCGAPSCKQQSRPTPDTGKTDGAVNMVDIMLVTALWGVACS
jgi:hypothetical protein